MESKQKCEITRFGLAPDLLHGNYSDNCQCVSKLSKLRTPLVARMKLAAVCNYRFSNGRPAGAFYYVGRVVVSGTLVRKLKDPKASPYDDSNDLMYLIPNQHPGRGWPKLIDFSPGGVYLEFKAPQPTAHSPCWRTAATVEVHVVRHLVEVDGHYDGEIWNGFIPLEKVILSRRNYVVCK